MLKNQLLGFVNICKKPAFILALIISAFFLREVFVATLFPILKGQDETAHYVTVQFLAEPAEKNWEITRNKGYINIRQLDTRNSSEELQMTIRAANLNAAQESPSSKLDFETGYTGKNEELINNNQWKQYIDTYPPGIVGGVKFYHWLASFVEKAFSDQSIFVRFYLARILSVAFGTLFILTSYFILKNIGFSEKRSLLMTAIISFQPKLAVYTTNINYDSLLILFFAVFTLGGILFLKNGPDWKNLLLLLGAFVGGLFTKGTGIALAGPLIALALIYLYGKIKAGALNRKHTIALTILTLFAAGLFFYKYDLVAIIPSGSEELSFAKFLSKSLEKTPTVSKNYWGNLDWTRNDYSENFIQIIWVLEAMAIAGIIFFLFSKKIPPFLPQKKYVFFLLLMLFTLQFGIAFSDWRITASGTESLFAAPGRYFLPNLAAHIALMFAGLGMLLRKEKYLDGALIFGLLLMFAFNFYIIFNVIIPRFYF